MRLWIVLEVWVAIPALGGNSEQLRNHAANPGV